MPLNSEILSVQRIKGSEDVCIWAMVETTNSVESREFYVYGTGHEINVDVERLKHLGTFQIPSDNPYLPSPLVFHVFELEK